MWQRQLAGGDWALLLFNNGLPAPSPIECSGGCWSRMGLASAAVRDVIARTDNGTATGGFTAVVPTNGSVLVRLHA